MNLHNLNDTYDLHKTNIQHKLLHIANQFIVNKKTCLIDSLYIKQFQQSQKSNTTEKHGWYLQLHEH